ncbi:MAG: family oxidoreductase [Sphingomonadales bacterium]|nr:family oxidoreductase [Sphingomonadales bacterium]
MTDNASRRDLLIAAAATGAAAAATPAFAQTNTSRPGVDPQTKYPSQPFAEQRQKWPALQREMQPVPDCGERTYRGSGKLLGRKALVTGGDSGIGRAAVIAFAREGADVAINYFPTEEPDAQDVARLLRAEGHKIVLIPGDLTKQDFCLKLVARANQELGGLDILVNNAAYQQSKASIDEISFEQFDRTLKTNLYAMFWITKTAIPLMKPGAAIINTASVNSFSPEKEILDYATTKGGIAIFTKALAKQLSKKGIRVNAVAPGPIWTPLQVAGGQLPGEMAKFGQDTPLGRAGQPAELAPLYVMLASGELSYTDGSVLGANGGTGIS